MCLSGSISTLTISVTFHTCALFLNSVTSTAVHCLTSVVTGEANRKRIILNVACFCPCRSYGCVFKAHYKETGEIVAIKQVPVESDLQEIIKEISIMQQCNRYDYSRRPADL